MTEQLQTDYLDRYGGVQAERHQVSQFEESSAVTTAKLSKVYMSRKDTLRAQDNFLLTLQFTTIETFLDVKDCKIHLNSGATKGFMS